jgi:LysM repeat protein
MNSDHPSSPFDVELDEAAFDAALVEQFWGPSRGQTGRVSKRDTDRESWRDDTTGAIRAVFDGVAAFRPRVSNRTDVSGEVQRTREHRLVAAPTDVVDQTANVPDDMWEWDDELDVYLGVEAVPRTEYRSEQSESARRTSLGPIGPFFRYIGLILLVGLLLVPLALALRPGETPPASVQSETTEVGPENPVPSLDPSTADVGALPLSDAGPEANASIAEADQSGIDATSVGPETDVAQVAIPAVLDIAVEVQQVTPAPEAPVATNASVANSAEVATVSATAERVIPECPQTYVAGAGDSWFRIAGAANVTPDALLRENRATADTVMFPGDEICLPAGATMPSQPTPPTTAPPPTTDPPATTIPTTTAPPASTAEVQRLIREVWPDDLEQKALDVAFRESRYVATAYNGFCCYGVFQIYWTVHQSWLGEFGIHSSSDLFDARKNIEAAYGLYQRAGGWGPWGG